jgi:hypothetical protein
VSPTAETIIAVCAVILTVLVFAAWRDMSQRPRRWRFLSNVPFWRRAAVWSATLSVAAAAGAVLAGEMEFALALLVCGLMVTVLALRVWSWARLGQRLNGDDD